MPETIGVDELKSLETSVLKALCLTINTAGSELKYKILDSLADDDFYFPVLRAVFRTLTEMHLRGDYVISSNLEEELQKSAGEMPAGFANRAVLRGKPSVSRRAQRVGQPFEGAVPERARSHGGAAGQGSAESGRHDGEAGRGDEKEDRGGDAQIESAAFGRSRARSAGP